MLLMIWNRDMRIESPFLRSLLLYIIAPIVSSSSLSPIAGEINMMIHLIHEMISISSAVITRPRSPTQSNMQILKVFFSSIQVKFVELDLIQSSIGVLLDPATHFPCRITSQEQLV